MKPGTKNSKTNMATSLEAISLANHDFSFSLYTELAKKENGNLFYSPLSIHLIMFMASIGAASKTFDEMMTTIHLNKTTHSLEAYSELLDDLTSQNDKLKLATGMFIDTSFTVKDSFVQNSNKYLKSTMEKLGFKSDPEKQRQYLNNWVLSKTNNKIKDLFPQGSITMGTALVLANAVHFKSGWLYEFTDAIDEPFYLTPSKIKTVKMMTLIRDLQYYHDDELKFSAIELQYERYAFKMMILLPDAKDGLKNLENNFSKIKLHEISNKMSPYHVTVKLPRFKLEQSLDLKETLTNLGCPTMFTPAANFSNIAESSNLLVSKVIHKAYVDVNEKGTEAAAATGMSIRLKRSLNTYEPKDFIVDHPYVFYILTKIGSIVFVGRMTKIDSLLQTHIKEEL